MKARSRTLMDWMQAVGVSLSALMLVGTVLAQDIMPDEESFEGPKKEYSPFADDHFPTPRWTAYDAKRYGVTIAKEVPMVTQERAYTSPIWYTP